MKAHSLAKFVAKLWTDNFIGKLLKGRSQESKVISLRAVNVDLVEATDSRSRSLIGDYDRRGLKRKNGKARIYCESLKQEVPVIESSFGGARVVLPGGSEAGDSLSVQVQCAARIMTVDARIAWVSELGTGSVIAGLCF